MAVVSIVMFICMLVAGIGSVVAAAGSGTMLIVMSWTVRWCSVWFGAGAMRMVMGPVWAASRPGVARNNATARSRCFMTLPPSEY